MSRFQYGVSGKNNPGRRMFFSIVFFVGLFVFFLFATGSLSSGNTERQKESLYSAINKDVIYHYATTGRYPATLEEIEEKYALTYDKSSFYVDYDVRGENVMPTITIVELKKE